MSLNPELTERLLSDAMQHCNIAACSFRAGSPSLDSTVLDAIMLARAAVKAVHSGMGYSTNDSLDFVEVYETMLELVSDEYPIVPD